MTVFTGIIHRDHWQKFLGTVLPQLVDPGFRDEDFKRLKDAQLNALVQDLRSNNEEELGKERLQTNIFRGTPYAHVALGTVAGLDAITLDDVRQFAKTMYTRANLTLGLSGDAPDEMVRCAPVRARGAARRQRGRRAWPCAARGPRGSRSRSSRKTPARPPSRSGFRSTSRARIRISRRCRSPAPGSASTASRSGRLYQRIREVRGINYGDYAYIEAFPRGMFQFFPDPNVARQRQIFEIWIRPVVPVNAHMTLRIAVHELDRLIQNGLTKADFEATRDYLMNNVYVMTARQDQQLGYALDSQWYGIGEFTDTVRKGLQALTVEQVNAAIKRHLTAQDLSIVIITKDAAGLKQALVSDAVSTIKYDGDKPKALLDEDRAIGARKLNIAAEKVRITPIAEVFAR